MGHSTFEVGPDHETGRYLGIGEIRTSVQQGAKLPHSQ